MSTLTTQINCAVRILIVDDQKLIRKTIQIHLEQESDFVIAGSAATGEEAIEKIHLLEPDVVILDLEMPDMNGLTATKIIRERFPETKILVFSSHDERKYINQAIEAGAKGYLLKGTPQKELINAIRAVHQGYFQLGPGLWEKLAISINQEPESSVGSFEEKLLIALKKFKQDTDRNIINSIAIETTELEKKYRLNINTHMQIFSEKFNRFDFRLKQLETKFYQFILINFGLWFILLAYGVLRS